MDGGLARVLGLFASSKVTEVGWFSRGESIHPDHIPIAVNGALNIIGLEKGAEIDRAAARLFFDLVIHFRKIASERLPSGWQLVSAHMDRMEVNFSFQVTLRAVITPASTIQSVEETVAFIVEHNPNVRPSHAD